MLRIPAVLAGLFVAASIAAAADPKEEAVKKDLKALDGTWHLTDIVKDGKEVPIPPGSAVVELVISDGKYREKVGKDEVEVGTFTVDPSKSPKTMDVMILEGTDKGKKQFGLYELKGDELKVAFAPPGKDRPTALAGKEGVTVITYKRVK
jgi:uncharacterized protein (TIGR03067 family)